MRLLAVAIVLAAATAAWGQAAPLPQTGPITNQKTGKQIGTITQMGNRFFLRDMNGELQRTVIIESGQITMYDANGKVLDQRDLLPEGGK